MDTIDNKEVAKAAAQEAEKAKKKAAEERKWHREHVARLQKAKASFALYKADPIWNAPPSPSFFGTLYDFEYLDLQNLWLQYGIRGQGVNVAVVDSGIEGSHPSFLNQQSLNAISFVPGQASGDGFGHGTWVASKIGAEGVGIAPRCNLTSLRVLAADGSGPTTFSFEALKWVLHSKSIDIVNMSLGSFQNDVEQEKLLVKLANAGVVVVAAAGNMDTDQPFYPAAYKTTLSVSAIDRSMHRAGFADFGPYLDISAPGVSCYGCYLGGTFRLMSGTSMAAPIVTGLLTLGISLLKIRYPAMEKVKVRQAVIKALIDTATNLGPRDQFGFGGINGPQFLAALAAV